jgi:hypothetical protein
MGFPKLYAKDRQQAQSLGHLALGHPIEEIDIEDVSVWYVDGWRCRRWHLPLVSYLMSCSSLLAGREASGQE